MLILVLLFGGNAARAATIAVCAQDAEPAADGRLMYSANANPLALFVTDAPVTDAGCATRAIPGAAASVRWLSLTDIPPASVPASLVLQGRFSPAATVVSEVLWGAEPAAPAGILPFNADLLPWFEPRVFGVEERAILGDGFALACEAGTAAAGFWLQTARQWESAGATDLELSVRGNGDFQLAIADERRQQQQAPLVLGALELRGEPEARVFRFRLPANDAHWQRLTLLCPQDPATLAVDTVVLLPQEVEAPRSRSAWLWSPVAWRENAGELWRLAEQEQLTRLYLTIPQDPDGGIEQPEVLATFVAAARLRGLEVWAVVGDPRDVLEASLPALQRRLAAYLAYNTSVAADATLAGVQLDIEPHLLPGFALAQNHWRERYLVTITAAHGMLAGRLPLDLVLPVWWGEHPAWGEQLLAGLTKPDLSLTVMNYRTGAAQLRAGALPFLVWGQHAGVPVAMALETGSIGPDETRQHYARSDSAGELWLFQVADTEVLVLFDAPVAGLPGVAWRFEATTTAAASAITFGGDLQQLQTLATLLEAEWRLWSSYAGIALHGLEESYLTESGN